MNKSQQGWKLKQKLIFRGKVPKPWFSHRRCTKAFLSSENASHHVKWPVGSRFTWFAASAERKFFSRSKIWWIMRFSAVFLDFHIFQNLNGFGMFWALNLIPWRDLLPRDGSKSIWHRLSSICSISWPGNLSYSWSSWILCSLFTSIPDFRLRHRRALIYI